MTAHGSTAPVNSHHPSGRRPLGLVHRIDSLDHQIASTDSNNAAMRYVVPQWYRSSDVRLEFSGRRECYLRGG
jgi:hypothetical protein